ncbi:hypothetical protein PENSPDRAFT_756635 [Peniophora sp. CONT]|nr:hypothetical protein PENSPDRAFT_756635 [Peniophora sp. CONT]
MAHDNEDFLDTVEGEITFFRSLMRARPVGLHKHFHALSMRTAIHQDTGHFVTLDAIWDKLNDLYNLKALEDLDAEGYDSPEGSGTPHVGIPSPDPDQNLTTHPFFRNEFELPLDSIVESELAKRRIRSSPSPTPSSAPTPSASAPRGKKRPRPSKSKTKSKLAGTGEDSDASELTQYTQDDDDVSMADVQTESGTVDGTEDGESPGPSRKRGGNKKPRGAGARGRGARASTSKSKKKR